MIIIWRNLDWFFYDVLEYILEMENLVLLIKIFMWCLFWVIVLNSFFGLLGLVKFWGKIEYLMLYLVFSFWLRVIRWFLCFVVRMRLYLFWVNFFVSVLLIFVEVLVISVVFFIEWLCLYCGLVFVNLIVDWVFVRMGNLSLVFYLWFVVFGCRIFEVYIIVDREMDNLLLYVWIYMYECN